MNPFHNPIFLMRLLKSYIIDLNRLWHTTLEELKRYQDKHLRKMVRYAYTVPLYHKKYREYGIHPDNIKGVRDLKKLPFITKQDLRDNYPDNIIPNDFDKKHGFLLSTSGSTGKPVFIYYDLFSAIKYVEGFVRMLKAYGGSWSKSKIVLIVDTKEGTIENAAFQESILPFISKFVKTDNIKYLYVGDPIDKLVKEVNDFKPDYLGSDPHMLREFAVYKNNGKADDINPTLIFSSEAMIDKYTRQYIEKAFNTKVLDTYGATEAGPIAFECIHDNGYHVNSDFVIIEALDDENHDVPYDTPGKLVVTRLYGTGTPIIRYTGVEDIITPMEPVSNCGITSEMIRSIGGRSIELIRLPNGETLAPFHVTTIPAMVMDKYNSYKIKQFQIIQHTIDTIEILVVIDEKLRNIGPPVELLLKEIQENFKRKVGADINIKVREVSEIEKDVRSDYVRVVISHVK
ncbi:MAG TPA: phenylacetate--CoA ligase family protein [Thermoplasmatales archaeon]|nr:phenylacetate--CoA ligase family protein [Thermoplasmatales archaeon]